MSANLIVIGARGGDLEAWPVLLAGLPREFPAAIVIAPHRAREADDGWLQALRKSSRLPVSEPEDKGLIMPGQVYLAPRDYHLLVEKGWFALSLEASVHHARPSIDVLFESAAEAYREQVVGIILTGVNDVQPTGKFARHSDDGARGLARIKALGGLTVAQASASAELPALPPTELLTAPADRILLLPQISLLLSELCPLIAR